MYVYHLVDIFTGQRLEPLTPSDPPSWARRPEPVAWSIAFNVRPDPQPVASQVVEGNPMAGLQHRIRPWRDVIVVSWQDGAYERALAAGIVSGRLALDEAAGTLTVDTVCIRSLLDDRFLLSKTQWPATRHDVIFENHTWKGLASEIVRAACRDYEPPDPDYQVGGFGLPVTRPPAEVGTRTLQWWGYQFKTAGEALEDLEEEAGLVVDFRPEWSGAEFRWVMEVFYDLERTGDVLVLGSDGSHESQVSYTGTTRDSADLVTVTHHTGKGSEVDILYTRKSDTTPSMVAREELMARPDVEYTLQLTRQANAAYREARKVAVQDRVSVHLDTDNPDWVQPMALTLGQTIQVTLQDSLQYGHTTLRRTLIGWKASGTSRIELDLQDLTVDAGV